MPSVEAELTRRLALVRGEGQTAGPTEGFTSRRGLRTSARNRVA
jgi:hypothetical protein